jgi:tRNA pseudouridine55 synthase
MIGVVNLDKPVGPTSHDMVGLVRRLTGIRRIGHAGTLDPLASGVLPILVGGATRLSEELTGGAKRYDAVIRLGERSETDDSQGPLHPGDGPIPADESIAAALATFVGTINQRPPAFSARKVGGTAAHREARAGRPVELPARQVTVHAIEMLVVERHGALADVQIDLRCGPGTYVRAIARDLGDLLGCGGHLRALRRTEAAGLKAADGITPRALEELAAAGRLSEALLPVGELLPLPRLELDADAARRFGNGSEVEAPASIGPGRYAIIADGELLGIGEARDGIVAPAKVIAEASTR